MTILDLFRDGPAFYLGQKLVGWEGRKLQFPKFIFWQEGAAILFVSLGVTAPLITPVAFCKGAWFTGFVFGCNDPTYYPSNF